MLLVGFYFCKLYIFTIEIKHTENALGLCVKFFLTNRHHHNLSQKFRVEGSNRTIYSQFSWILKQEFNTKMNL